MISALVENTAELRKETLEFLLLIQVLMELSSKMKELAKERKNKSITSHRFGSFLPLKSNLTKLLVLNSSLRRMKMSKSSKNRQMKRNRKIRTRIRKKMMEEVSQHPLKIKSLALSVLKLCVFQLVFSLVIIDSVEDV